MEAKQKSPKEWIILFQPQQWVKYRDYNFPTTSNPRCQCATFCGDEVSFSSILLACLSVYLYPFPIDQPSCWSNLVRYLNTVPGMDSMSLHRPYPNRYTVPMLMKPLSKFSEKGKHKRPHATPVDMEKSNIQKKLQLDMSTWMSWTVGWP